MSSFADILEKLKKKTSRKISLLESFACNKIEFEKSISDLQKKFKEALKIEDEDKRELRLSLLDSELVQLCEDIKQDEKYLVEVRSGLEAILRRFRKECSNLLVKSPEEEKLVGDVEIRLAKANSSLQMAQTKFFFKVTIIKNANLKTAVMVTQKRLEQVIKQLQITAVKKAESFAVKNKTAQTMKKLDKELNEAEADLKKQEELLLAFVNGTPDYIQQEQKISNLKSLVEDLKERRNIAFVLFSSKEQYVAILGIQERQMIKLRSVLRNNLKKWIASNKNN